MANFNGFPVNYPYLAPNYGMMQPQQAQPQQSGVIWVQGENGAKSYLLAPNTTLPLFDSEKQTIYLKTADASGMPSMKVLDYTIRENANLPHTGVLNEQGKEYATKDELEALKGEIMAKLSEVTGV